ncbi:hypothetical protein AB0I35_14005 [Nocardia sp. NPDC050378]|uniref:hypothetical protein n=1 Tax=Nocardia sp. NPDC050378 TaxID=3155400 RepID=UPI0033D0F39F
MRETATAAGAIRTDIDPYLLLRGIGNVCIGAESDRRYDARRVVELIVAGLRLPR